MSTSEWKLTDTGFAKETSNGTLIMSTRYTAPEMKRFDTVDWHKCDVYALGVVILDLCGGRSQQISVDSDWIIRKFVQIQKKKNTKIVGSLILFC
jgi:serine/threonine protein kinase